MSAYVLFQFDPTNRYVLSNQVEFEHRTPKADDVIQGERLPGKTVEEKQEFPVEGELEHITSNCSMGSE